MPSRFLPIACLCLAALAAFAVARVPWRYAALAAIPLVALDLRVDVYRPMGADEDNPVYTALRLEPHGPMVEQPVFSPDLLEGSVYLYYAIQAPNARPVSYSTTAPPEADRLVARLEASGANEIAILHRLGVRYIVTFRNGRPVRYMPIE